MESGRLQFDCEQFSEAIALIGLGGKGEGSFSLLHRLVSEASASYPQLSQLRLLQISLPVSRLESWSHWLAAQVVEQWRDLPVENHSVATILDELELSSFESSALLFMAVDKTATNTPLHLQLAERFKSLHERQRQQKLAPSRLQQWLEQEAAGLAAWFSQPLSAPSESSQSPMEGSSCLAQLQFNVLALRSKTRHQLQDCFVRLLSAGSRALLTWSGSLSEALEGLRVDCETQWQSCLRQESSAWRAYYKLSAIPQEHKWRWSGQGHLNWEAALRALATVYNCKLKAEMYSQTAQVIGELVQQTHLYTASVAQADAMLASLQDWLTERSSVEPLFVPLLKDSLAQHVKPAQLLSEAESWIGCTLDQWGTLESTQCAALCEQILARTRPLCLEVYAECCRCVLNLDPSDRQTQLAKTDPPPASATLAKMPPNPEKRLSLQVRNADIRDVLALLGRVSGEKVVGDDSLNGAVSLALDNSSFTEALNALVAAGNLTYTKSGDVYTFSQRLSADAPATAMQPGKLT